jgi:hypothetical protein
VARIGPVTLTTLNDLYASPCRVLALVWEGETVAGNQAEVRDPVTNALLWTGRAVDTQTYVGLNVGPTGIHCPNGFQATTLDAGQILVYLHEVI